MRVFWILLVVLLLAAGGVLLARPSEDDGRSPAAAAATTPPRPMGRPATSGRRPKPATPSPPEATPPETSGTATTRGPADDAPSPVAAAVDPAEPRGPNTTEVITTAPPPPTAEPAAALPRKVVEATPKIDPESIVSTPSGKASDAGVTPAADPPSPERLATEQNVATGPDETKPKTTEEDAAKTLAAELLASAEQRERGSDPVTPDTATAATEPTVTPVREPAGETADANDVPPAVATPSPDPSASTDTTTVATGETTGETETEAETEAEAEAEAVAMVRQDDGSWLVDDRFVLRGTGSEGDPYRVAWEHLVAAAETYKPRKGMTEIPQWIQMLDGQQVKLTGYLAFPLASQTVDEALIMLNQWDGCCIGVPPSPYDGVEVRLGAPIQLKEGHFFRFGNVTGTFKVDPYLVNDWLVGLYLIEEAKLEAGM